MYVSTIEEYNKKIKYFKNINENIKEKFHIKKGKFQQLSSRKNELEEKKVELIKRMELNEDVKALLQKVSLYSREKARVQIEELVTNCLQSIFDSNMCFRIEINEVRERPEAEFFVITRVNDEEIKTRPHFARGGGVVDIISLALRVALMQCGSISMQGPLILDEPARHVSDEYIVHVAEFLSQVSKMFGRQVIMITHNNYLGEIADKLFRVSLSEGKSYVTN